MGDDFVQVAPDSTGKKVDNASMVVGANTVYRQRVVVSDNASTGNHLGVDANGNVGISNTSFTVVAMNAGTITAATISNFPASQAVTGTFWQATQPVSGTFWQATQPVSFSAGTVSFSAGTVTSAVVTAATVGAATVTAGTVGSATITAGTVGSATITAGTVGSATITAGTVSANQGTANATPWNENLAQVGGSTIAAVTKGVQTANALQTQHFMDAGRTPITFNADRITGTTAETALTVTINKNGTTSSASTYLITTGKVLHIQGVYWSVRATSTTLVSGRGRLRYAGSSAAPTTATALLLGVESSAIAALAESTGPDNTELARGLELAGNTAIGFSHIESSTLSSVSMNVIAFEY